MTRTNPSKTKPRMDKTTNRKQADRKQIIFTEGAKGGGGKTTLLSSLADFFLAESIPVKLVDADIDNKSRGSLSHLFRGTPKIDIRTDHGLDQFIGLVLDDNAQTVLADRGLGLRKVLEPSAEIAGPVLSKSYNRMRIKGYVNRLEKQFSEVIDVLLPPYEAFAGK